jgi:pilus assembly protein Flp/PilA
MLNVIKRFVREEEGATMVEYGLMVALIAVVCILVVAALGQQLGLTFNKVQTEVKSANDSSKQVQPT